jgi:EAL domain-containing protein (putative c-di-GMP-specific phosphodiesterase class I)
VNVSARQFQQVDFVQTTAEVLTASRLNPQYLELELTESLLMSDPKNETPKLQKVRELGCGIAIDDFGTGYSSLMQLRQLPFTEVKIDQAFVADLPYSRDSRLIIQAVTDLAHGLGLTTTAEGVETIEQLRIIRELGCDCVQGYLVSAPLDPKALKPWIQKFRRAWPAMIAEEKLALWGDVETDPLSERQI